MTAYDTLFLSPHLDDAVLSCGGFIHRLTSEGKRVLVATVFSGDLVDACGAPRATSDAVGQVLAMMDLPLGEAMARRRREDERACARLGAELLHLDLPEALVRVGVDGQAIYGSVGSLFGAVDPRDAPFLETVVEAFRDLPPAWQVVAPLTVGGHVDHRLTRQAAERVHGDIDLLFYEDFPYVTKKWLAAERLLGRGISRWTTERVALSPSDLQAKVDAVAAYESQVGPLFGGPAAMESSVRRWARKTAGERYRRLIPQ